MGYLLSPSPSPALAFQYATPPRLLGRPRARRGEAFVVASDASPLDGGPSSSLSAAVAAGAYVLARRVVLLGASAVSLVRLREAAAAPTPVDSVKDVRRIGIGIGICYDIRFQELAIMSHAARAMTSSCAHFFVISWCIQHDYWTTALGVAAKGETTSCLLQHTLQLEIPVQVILLRATTLVGPLGEVIATTEHEESTTI